MIFRSTLYIICLLQFSFFLVCINAQENEAGYAFFVAGHVYGNALYEEKGLYQPFKNYFEYINSRDEIQLGFFTGDIVAPFPNENDWDKVDADLNLLEVPVYFAVGNHDMENRSLFEERYGKTYYSFEYKNDLFIVLDPNIDGWNISGEQLEFLKNKINNIPDNSNNVFIFMHQLIWVPGNKKYADIKLNSFAGKKDTINYSNEIYPLLSGLENHVCVFGGDLGGASWSSDIMFDNMDNITYLAGGMGEGNGDNFVVVNVKPDKNIEYDLICLDEQDTLCKSYSSLLDIPGERNIELNKLKLFPNPAHKNLTVESFYPGSIIVEIINIYGQKVSTFEISGYGNKELNISNIPDGYYILGPVNNKSKNFFLKK